MNVPQVDVQTAHDRMQNGTTMVDVREDDEWARARIPGTLHIPLSRFMDHLKDIPQDQPVMIHCAVGARSAQVAAWLNQNGYDATNVAGGIQSWAAEGLPLEP